MAPLNAPAQPARGGEFTHQGYADLLAAFGRQGYAFHAFSAAERLLDGGEPFVLLRHDLDMSLERALPIARLDAAAGVRSTFFVMLRTEHYNPLSAAGDALIRQILGLGHQLGLHFDARAYPELAGAPEDAHVAALIQRLCAREAEILEQWFGVSVPVVSFHQPNPLALAGAPELTAPRLHTYMALFNRRMAYYADSTGRWRFGHPLGSEAFAQRRPMQLLIHPIWWNETPLSPARALDDFVEERIACLDESLALNCKSYERRGAPKES